jgi:hypothetical protein
MCASLRTVLVGLTAAAAAVTLTAGPGLAATSTGLAGTPWCGADECGSTDLFRPSAVQIGLTNKLNAMLDEFPSSGIGRPSVKV